MEKQITNPSEINRIETWYTFPDGFFEQKTVDHFEESGAPDHFVRIVYKGGWAKTIKVEQATWDDREAGEPEARGAGGASLGFDEYQAFTGTTATFVGAGSVMPVSGDADQTEWLPPFFALTYLVPALAAEAGEVAGKFAKIVRDRDGSFRPEDILVIGKELGDVQYMIAQICSVLGISLEAVAQGNKEKLEDRLKRGVIQGSGDNR